MSKIIENIGHAFFGFIKAVVDFPYEVKRNYHMNQHWALMLKHYVNICGYDLETAKKLLRDRMDEFYGFDDEEE